MLFFPCSDKKALERLSQDATDRLSEAISAFTAINSQLVGGHIKISLLSVILERRDSFLELLQIGNNMIFQSRF